MNRINQGRRSVNILSLGGNELLKAGNKAMDVLDQFSQTYYTGTQIKKVVEARPDDYFVLVHGNGPQVGRIQQAFEVANKTGEVLLQPYYIGGAQSQGEIGYIIKQSFQKAGVPREIVPLVTPVVVARDDPAFMNPTKFVGRTFTLEELAKLHGSSFTQVSDTEYHVSDSSGNIIETYKKKEGSYRKVVASPMPIDISDVDAVTLLMENGYLPITAGGGGIPVVRMPDGNYEGIEAVIDKDFASAKLAEKLVAHYAGEERDVTLTIVTAVPGVYMNYKKPDETFMSEMKVEEAQSFLQQGHFPPGSMGPKVQAAISAVESGVSRVIITDSENLLAALEGNAGTAIYR